MGQHKTFGDRHSYTLSSKKSSRRAARCALLALAFVLSLGSQAANADESNEDEYSFKWLDPDKKIYVLQNRRYEKSGRFLLSAMVGIGMSNPYRSTFVAEPRIAFYLSESIGIEGFYTLGTNSTNSTFDALQAATSNTLPLVREIKSQAGALIHWSPWYAKINVFNSVLYFDWYFSGGAGTLAADALSITGANVTTLDESLFAIYLGTGHQYHLSRDFIVRLDFTGAFYRAKIAVNQEDTAWFSNYNFNVGVGLRL